MLEIPGESLMSNTVSQQRWPRWIPRILESLRDKIVDLSIGYRLARGAFWSLTGTIMSRGLGIISSIIVARLLGKSSFGELGIIQSTVGMFGTFAGFGMGVTATKFIAEFRKSNPARAGQIIGLSSMVAWISGATMAIALVWFAPWLASHFLAAPHLTRFLRIASLMLAWGR